MTSKAVYTNLYIQPTRSYSYRQDQKHHHRQEMGWFKSTPSTGKISADGKPEAPNRHDRQHCWEARDAFFACLDRNNILDSIRDDMQAQKQCGAESVVFDQNCAQTWVGFSLCL